MATIAPTTVFSSTGSGDGGKNVAVTTWLLGNADTGAAVQLPGYTDQTLQVSGTWGSATVVLKGSNDNVTFIQLNNTKSTTAAISLTADGQMGVLENPLLIQVVSSGGSGTVLVATLVSRR